MGKVVVAYYCMQLLINVGLQQRLSKLATINVISIFYWLFSILTAIIYLILHKRNPGYIIQEQQPLNQINVPNTDNKTQEKKNDFVYNEEKINTDNEEVPDSKSEQLKAEDFSVPVNRKRNPTEEQTESMATVVIDKHNIPSSTLTINGIEKKYCRLCHLDQPFRTRHCHECERCVMTFDHHCPWIENCVGEKNRPIFYLYLLSQIIQTTFAEILILVNLQWNNLDYSLIGFFIVIVLITIMVLPLFLYHNYLMAINVTTWEFLSWSKISYLSGRARLDNPFNRGFAQNIAIYWRAGFQKEFVEWKISN